MFVILNSTLRPPLGGDHRLTEPVAPGFHLRADGLDQVWIRLDSEDVVNPEALIVLRLLRNMSAQVKDSLRADAVLQDELLEWDEHDFETV